MENNRTDLQHQREDYSAQVGKKKLADNTEYNQKTGNASNTDFGLYIKQHLMSDVVKHLEATVTKTLGSGQVSEVSLILQKCIRAKPDGTTAELFDVEVASLLGIQKLLDTALCPNHSDGKIQGRFGSDKRIFAKKTLAELSREVGRLINKQMKLDFISQVFPNWYRRTTNQAEYGRCGLVKATTSQWETRMDRAIESYADWLRAKGDDYAADFLTNSACWTTHERNVIGGLVLKSAIWALGDYIEIVDGVRFGKSKKPRKTKEIQLTAKGQHKEQQITNFVANHAHDLLPMLVQPRLITNGSLGGFMTDSLQEKQWGFDGSFELSNEHQEFINRQARVKFQTNPFTVKLLNYLYENKLSLGKFYAEKPKEHIDVAAQLGLAWMGKCPEQDTAVHNHPDFQKVRDINTRIAETNKDIIRKNRLGSLIVNKLNKIADDDYHYFPMDYCSRGRIYTRVPFISGQSSDAGKYALRFYEKTPVDVNESRTKFWFKVGIANAGGMDKMCWDDRIKWFDNNEKDIINVGRMMTTGNFERAYEFLQKAEEPFAMAALADEYVKVYVDESQTYTQTYVYVDCSCSGTSIMNAWLRNKHGASKTNLIDTPAPTDIYMAVWEEIKAKAPEGVFRTSHIKRLEKTKHLRKLMKTTFVPASYAQYESSQHKHIREFNDNLPPELRFKSKSRKRNKGEKSEVDWLCELWTEALDKVSSINSVVGWFKKVTSTAMCRGRQTIKYTTCNGSVMTLRYPKTKMRKTKTLGWGSAQWKSDEDMIALPEVDKRAMRAAVTANVVHATDASILSNALYNWDVPFVALHDAVALPPGVLVDEGIRRLKEGFVVAARHNVWDTFRQDNDVPFTAGNTPPTIDDLDINDIMRSSYLFS